MGGVGGLPAPMPAGSRPAYVWHLPAVFPCGCVHPLPRQAAGSSEGYTAKRKPDVKPKTLLQEVRAAAKRAVQAQEAWAAELKEDGILAGR